VHLPWNARCTRGCRSVGGRAIFTMVAILCGAAANATAGRATADGMVKDAEGRPVPNATVLVYSAGVRTGYSRFCPTCYVDCGKHAMTDATGRFAITGLDDALTFNLLVVRDGYAPKWIPALDPLKGAAAPTTIAARQFTDDPQRVIRAKVVDAAGTPVPYALVETEGATFVQGGSLSSMFGGFATGDSLAVANENGEFALPVDRPVIKALLRVSGRGKAPMLLNVNTGLDSKVITVGDGATVHGRLLKDAKPLSNVELALTAIGRMSGTIYPEERVSTDEKGRFAFTNVPSARVWSLTASSESLAGRGAMAPLLLATERDGQEIDLGNVQLQDEVSLAGRVELTDHKSMPEGVRLTLQPLQGDNQMITLAENGSFKIRGLMPGAYLIYPAIKGYSAPDKPYFEVLAKRDVTNLVLRLQPDEVVH
jgi:uncharacterized GH25 family protein